MLKKIKKQSKVKKKKEIKEKMPIMANSKYLSKKILYKYYKYIIFFIVFTLCLIYLTILVREKQEEWSERLEYEFTIRDVEVVGISDLFAPTVYTLVKDLLNVPIFNVSLPNVRKQIKDLSFVSDVSVRRVLPSKLEITIIERHPPLIWQDDSGSYHVLNEERKIIGNNFPKDRENRIVVLKGQDALNNVYQLLSILALNRDIFKRIDVVSYNSGNWIVLIKDGIIIKLPNQEDILSAWSFLVATHKKNQILDREISIIDLRLNGKIIAIPKKSQNLNEIAAP